MRRLAVTLLALAAGQVTVPLAMAHVAPAVEENNRYIKLSPMGTRIQVAYVVFAGEVPGREIRAKMGGDSKAFGHALADRVRTGLELEVNTKPVKLTWERVSVALDASKEHPNALSISMVAWICLDDAPIHRLAVRDRFEFPPPGETQLTVEPAPGVNIKSSVLGDESKLEFEWVGMPNPMAEQGYELEYSVAPGQVVAYDDSRCPSRIERKPDTNATENEPRTWIVVVLAGLVLLAGLGVVLVRRRTPDR